jgi:uncharacterized protein YhbP (UPF0306 family)
MAAARLRSIAAKDASGARVKARRLSAARVERTLFRILKKNPLCGFATVTPDGRAHVNTAYFAYSRSLEIYFLSHPDSLHCRNVTANPTMAIAVFESAQTWGALDRGLQLFGTCREARGAVARQAHRAYAARFKPYAQWIAELEADDTAHEYRFYRFVASRVKVFDEREFGGAVFVTARISRNAKSARK